MAKEELLEEFLDYTEAITPLPEDFVRRYAMNLVKEHNASLFLEDVSSNHTSKDAEIAVYEPEDRLITFSYDEIKKSNRKNRNILNYNFDILEVISHECFHAIQMSKLDLDTVEGQIFRDTLELASHYKSLYNDVGYQFSPLEINAQLEAYLYVNEFMSAYLMADDLRINNQVTMSKMLDEIRPRRDKFVFPTKNFYTVMHEPEKYEELDITKLSNYKKLLLGLKVDPYYLKHMIDIEEGDKKILNLRRNLQKM